MGCNVYVALLFFQQMCDKMIGEIGYVPQLIQDYCPSLTGYVVHSQ